MTPARVRYALRWEDYVTLSCVLRAESVWKRYQLVIVPAALSVGLLVGLAAVSAWNGQSVSFAIRFALSSWMFWVLAPALMVLIVIMNRIELALWYRRQKVNDMEIEVGFDDARGLVFESREGMGVLAWAAIRRLVTRDDCHIVLQQNRILGSCIPRRAFASDAEFQAAGAFIADRITEARSTSP